MTEINKKVVSWSIKVEYEDNYEWLEELVYNAIAENYIDAHQNDSKSVANDFDKVGG